ncbi:hypothetical protein [Actinosynnema mirum]|uniref:Uncharacterized protein n=1 Tax=Actinosynnema mirum (strain ATCC 29888 / DSM 43827 / JCM 3225 / NBRC 14064 / NCIMB 13271 / NRRL B-12336 / IMRU 3971 / 101) TaxID=446462 RepID=C6WBM8_ACTMD|nr:hypothetical protein [Actinosynnema mirum]ACU35596.1 conserved hypothetical protein [Actinosynnema mirum DSM 43827]
MSNLTKGIPPVQTFRKRPVTIEAVRFESAQDGSRIAEWCGGTNEVAPDQIQITTPEGVMCAGLGDWVIRGVAGEFYPCKHSIFEATYDLA